MQVEEVVRSAMRCMESFPVDDPRCLAAVQELYSVVSSLRASDIRALCTSSSSSSFFPSSSSTSKPTQATRSASATSLSSAPVPADQQQQQQQPQQTKLETLLQSSNDRTASTTSEVSV